MKLTFCFVSVPQLQWIHYIRSGPDIRPYTHDSDLIYEHEAPAVRVAVISESFIFTETVGRCGQTPNIKSVTQTVPFILTRSVDLTSLSRPLLSYSHLV